MTKRQAGGRDISIQIYIEQNELNIRADLLVANGDRKRLVCMESGFCDFMGGKG